LSFSLIFATPNGCTPNWLLPRADHLRLSPALTKEMPPLSDPSMVITVRPGTPACAPVCSSRKSELMVVTTLCSQTAGMGCVHTRGWPTRGGCAWTWVAFPARNDREWGHRHRNLFGPVFERSPQLVWEGHLLGPPHVGHPSYYGGPWERRMGAWRRPAGTLLPHFLEDF